MLDTPRATTGSGTNAGGNSEAGESANQGASHSGEDQSGRNEVAGGSMNDSSINADCESLFVTTRLGSYADPIPETNRQPYPSYNDPRFPQETHLTGIRARKPSLASLVSE
ncbi:unnamed protein product [Phytophthora fragariaefolia]|uniref:Unnamed protein product n=1 Tax=Phytophthora fragariaefolia TaxID=1490495 RepID=A0A9W7CIA6_9STRA|nr:unnamed protein product [Phytophthora fragariaefolia]